MPSQHTAKIKKFGTEKLADQFLKFRNFAGNFNQII